MATTKKTESKAPATEPSETSEEAVKARSTQAAPATEQAAPATEQVNAPTYESEIEAFKELFASFYQKTRSLKRLARKEGRPDAARLHKLEKALIRNSRYAQISLGRQDFEPQTENNAPA